MAAPATWRGVHKALHGQPLYLVLGVLLGVLLTRLTAPPGSSRQGEALANVAVNIASIVGPDNGPPNSGGWAPPLGGEVATTVGHCLSLPHAQPHASTHTLPLPAALQTQQRPSTGWAAQQQRMASQRRPTRRGRGWACGTGYRGSRC